MIVLVNLGTMNKRIANNCMFYKEAMMKWIVIIVILIKL